MEQYKDEKYFLESEGVNTQQSVIFNNYNELIEPDVILSKYKAYLIDQEKKGDLTFDQCKENIAHENGFISWQNLVTSVSMNGVMDYCGQAAEMYAMQFIPVAPAERWISVKDTKPKELPFEQYKLLVYGEWGDQAMARYQDGYYYANDSNDIDTGDPTDITNLVTHFKYLSADPEESTTSTKKP